MVKVKCISLMLMSLMLGCWLQANAQYRVVLDAKCVKQVAQNTAIQKAYEESHNRYLDSIRARQEKIQQMTTTMAVIAETYQYVMQNVKGFGEESKYYTEIGLCAYDIVARIPRISKEISKANITQKALCIKELGDVYLKTSQLVSDFVNIVNNAKVKHPLESGKKKDEEASKGDGYNLLNRYQRLALANRIYADLLKIKYKMEAIEMMAHYATWQDLWLSIDPHSWATVMTAKNNVEGIIQRWKNFKP